MWLLFALIGTIFYAIVHILDSHCVGNIFEKPWFGVITGAMSSMIIYPIAIIISPFISWELPTLTILLLSLLAGFFLQLSYYFYFVALSHSEAGIIAAYWNMVPALLPITTYLFIGNSLSLFNYLGIVLLILFSTIMCLVDSNTKTRWRSFFLMLLACCAQLVSYLLQSYIFNHINFITGFYAITTGLILTGLLPLLIPQVRKTFVKSMYKIRPSVHVILMIEIANLLALFSIQRSVSLNNPSLVSAIITTLPGFIFILSIILIFVNSKFGDSRTKHQIAIKFATVLGMVIGVILVSR